MKNIFAATIQSVIDVITNSSSELFVGKFNCKEELEKMIKEIYPNYLSEYQELKNIDELTVDDLDCYVQYFWYASIFPTENKSKYSILPGFTFDELYREKGVAWNDVMQYELKVDEHYNFVTKNNLEEFKNKIDPERKMYFLFSLDDNLDYDYQEKLEVFMDRFHLGWLLKDKDDAKSN